MQVWEKVAASLERWDDISSRLIEQRAAAKLVLWLIRNGTMGEHRGGGGGGGFAKSTSGARASGCSAS